MIPIYSFFCVFDFLVEAKKLASPK